MSNDIRLKLAIQKSGRLAEGSIKLLEKCGVNLLKSKDQLFCRAQDFPLDVYFVRDDDIPTFVSSGTCDLGIVGQNVLRDQQMAGDDERVKSLKSILDLGFGKCRLSIAVPNCFEYQGLKSLNGRRIATSYAPILKDYLSKKNINCDFVSMQGAVEIAPRIGMADGICDLVSTGTTLTMNGLREVEVIMKSQSVLVQCADIEDKKKNLLERFLLRLQGVLSAKSSKYVMLHCTKDNLEKIKSSIPGSESPTVLNLQGRDDLVAVHAVCDEGIFWNTMEDLKALGASSILVMPIEKMLD